MEYRRRWMGGTVLALSLLLPGCAPQSSVPEAPFGGDLSRPLPSKDVLGFARVHRGGPVWGLLESGLQWSSPLPIDETPLAPLVRGLRFFLEADLLDDGDPLVILFLEPSVHGGLFAFAFPGTEEAFLGSLERSAWLTPAGGARVSFGPRPAGDLVESLARQAPRVPWDRRRAEEAEEAESGPPAMLHYSFTGEDGYLLLMPQRDGRRHLVDTLWQTQVLGGAAHGADFVRLDVGQMIRGVREDVRDNLAEPLAVLTALPVRHSSGNLLVTYGRDWRRRERLVARALEFGLDVLADVDHLFLMSEGAGVELYVRCEPDGITSDLFAALAEKPTAELKRGFLAGDLQASLAFDAGRARAFWQEHVRPWLTQETSPEDPTPSWDLLALGLSVTGRPAIEARLSGPAPPESVERQRAFLKSGWEALASGPLRTFGLRGTYDPQVEGSTTDEIHWSEQGEPLAALRIEPGRTTAAFGRDARERLRSPPARSPSPLDQDLPESAAGLLSFRFLLSLVGVAHADPSGLHLSLARPGF